MEFFEKLGKKASETYKTAAEKTNKIASETKLKLKINDNKSKINEIYEEIGRKVYQKYVLDGNLDIKDCITDELNKISQLTDEIESFEKQRLELSDMKQCVKCKNTIDRKAKFCPECGAEQPEDVVAEAEIIEEPAQQDSAQNESNSENVSAETDEIVAEVVIEENNNEQDNPEENNNVQN